MKSQQFGREKTFFLGVPVHELFDTDIPKQKKVLTTSHSFTILSDLIT